MKDIRPDGRLKSGSHVRKIEQTLYVVLDIHSGGIESKGEISAQRSKLPVLLDLRQNRTDTVGVAGRIAVVEVVLCERESDWNRAIREQGSRAEIVFRIILNLSLPEIGSRFRITRHVAFADGGKWTNEDAKSNE